jgi:hypothetical protein
LNWESFASVTEAPVLVEHYRRAYHYERPHSALGYHTPAEFATEHIGRRHDTVTSALDGAPAFDLSHWEDELNIPLEPILS